jgi:prepilin-type N-terminal cleavage/methylation domain-containing protein
MYRFRRHNGLHEQRWRRTERGLTLLEVMIALVILSIGLLALSGMQMTSIKANGSGFKSTTAVSLADQEMQRLKMLSFSNAQLTAGAHTPTPASVTVSVGTSDGTHGVVYGRSYTVTDNSPIAGVKLIAYSVTWTDGGTHSVSLISRKGNESL